jgi:arylsulfatase A-like enzyme
VFTKPELDSSATFDYTKDYLSANNFQDQFLKNLTQLFADRDLLKNTLFIFNGDHAISLGEHGLQEQAQIPYDSPFKVPIFLYTEHPDWKPILQNQIIHGDRSTLDLVPTVLDILNPHFRWDTELDYGYEGSSLLRPPKTKPKLTFSNPGFSSVQIRENGLKMLYQPQMCGFPVYDLKEDPMELKPLNLNTYKNGKYRNWKRYAQQQLQLMLEDIKSKYQPL